MSSGKRGKVSGFLKGARSFRVPKEFTSLAIKSFLNSLDCARALTVWILYESGEHEQLAQLEFNPLDYLDSDSLGDAYAATKFLSKYKGLTLSFDPTQRAFEKFNLVEAQCKQTNLNFLNLSRHPSYRGDAVWLHNAVIRKIDKILGEFDVEEVFRLPDWGPGATTLIKRRDASSAEKFQLEAGITRDLLDLVPLPLLREVYPRWGERLVNGKKFPIIQRGNKVFTVSKDATIDRVAATEPGINLWFQKAFGSIIRQRLLRVGIDLLHQDVNQRLAFVGSKYLTLATADLSSASDSLTVNVARELLPPRWFTALDICRSHYGNVNGSWVWWEKFSSMGNGFTFPLESLIFYAVAKCCAEFMHVDGNVSVYGDDVILPTPSFTLFSQMMNFYGFTVNMKKSHFASSFRESCGAHYFCGIDVKPIYLKDKLTSVLTVYRLANAVRRFAFRRNFRISCDSRLRSTFDLLVSKVPKALRLRIPEGFGDGGFISCLDEATPNVVRHEYPTQEWEGYKVTHLTEVRPPYEEIREGYLLASLWDLSKRDSIIHGGFGNVPSILVATGNIRREALRLIALNFKSFERPDEAFGGNRVPTGPSQTIVARSIARRWFDLGPWESFPRLPYRSG